MEVLERFDALSDKSSVRVNKRIFEQGYFIPLHWHSCFELEIVLSGKAEHILNGSAAKIGRGSAYILSQSDFHSFRAMEKTTLMNICFDPSLLDERLKCAISLKSSNLECEFDETETISAECLAEKLVTELCGDLAFQDIETTGVLSSLVIKILRKSEHLVSAEPPGVVQKAATVIGESFRGEITLGSIARQLSVSPNYLGRIFKKTMGVSYNEYVNNLRLGYACRLLATTALSVKEVAFGAGLASVEYFCFAFKQKLGYTPATYRDIKTGLGNERIY